MLDFATSCRLVPVTCQCISCVYLSGSVDPMALSAMVGFGIKIKIINHVAFPLTNERS